MKYFVGKVCTIITSPINRPFTESDLIEYFVTKIVSIDSEGVLGSHPKEGLMNYFRMDSIISIQEERVVNSTQVETKKLVEETPTSVFVNVNNLRKIVKDIKNNDIEPNVQTLKLKR